MEFENAKSFEDRQAALTYLVSTVFHEYLEQFTDDNVPGILGPVLRQGAAVMEEQVWGLNLFGMEGGKEAIKVMSGQAPYSWDENDNPVYVKDESVLPTPPSPIKK